MESHTPKHLFAILFIGFFAALGGVLYGYDLGIINGAFLFVQDAIPMSPVQLDFIVGSVLFGGAFATLITGPLSDMVGRKPMIVVSSVIFIIGVLLVSTATNYPMVISGRLIQGIGVGIITIVIPLYLSELMPAHVRGRAISAFQLLLTAGILFASFIGLYFTPTENWRGMFYSALVPGIIMLIGSLFLPKSPRWLFLKGRKDDALKALQVTRTEAAAKHELEQMQAIITDSQEDEDHHHQSIWQKRFMIPFIIVIAVACLTQLTGINSILQLSATLLKGAGLHSNVVAMLGSTAITGLNFVITVIALLLVDKIGRKILLTIGTGGATIALAFSGIVTAVMSPGSVEGYLLLVGILLFIFFFAIGPGVIVWLVISELLPARIRSTGMAIALFLNSMVSAVLATSFLSITRSIGYSGAFWICGGFTLLYFLITVCFVPEAKNKTLEEIEADFAHKHIQ